VHDDTPVDEAEGIRRVLRASARVTPADAVLAGPELWSLTFRSSLACERFVNSTGSCTGDHKQPFSYLIAIRRNF